MGNITTTKTEHPHLHHNHPVTTHPTKAIIPITLAFNSQKCIAID
jgi:hypothetical protein